MYSLNENNNLISCCLSSQQDGVTPVTNDDDWTVVDYASIDSNIVYTLKAIENLLSVSMQMQKSLFNSSPKKTIKDLYTTTGV